jgi:HAE1 family hydrophobic/amphiphilic exporter-1
LLTATGAGAASQRALGTVVFGGMLASTLIAIPFVPVFYIETQRFAEWRSRRRTDAALGLEAARRASGADK